jgi:hypothetical protein
MLVLLVPITEVAVVTVCVHTSLTMPVPMLLVEHLQVIRLFFACVACPLSTTAPARVNRHGRAVL